MPEINFNVTEINIKKEAEKGPHPFIKFDCIAWGEEIEQLNKLNKVLLKSRYLKKLKFYISWEK